VRYLKALVEATRWLYDPKNKEEDISIHMKVLKSTRESADDDYKYLVQDRSQWRAGQQGFYDKTMELRAKEGLYQGRKIRPLTEYVDSSYIEEALKQLEK